MSAEDTPNGTGKVKTLAIRLEPDLHAQLSLIAQLRGSTITDEIRSAIENHIEAMRAVPELAAQAESALDEVEREAAFRRSAIATLFGEQSGERPQPSTSAARSRSRKATGETPAES